MAYLQGFLIPVKAGNKQAYLDLATSTWPIFHDYGAERTIETWGEELPDGKRTDMKRAVAAEADETVVFSWIFYPDKATVEEAKVKMQADPRMAPGGRPMPFDGRRMVYGGFDIVFDSGADGTGAGAFGFVDGMVAAVPANQREAFVAFAASHAALFQEKGATRVVDGWGDDVPVGKTTDFYRAVDAQPGVAIVFGWIEWPDKPTRDAAWGALMADPRMRELTAPWDGPTAIFGGFAPILDTDNQ